MADKSAIEWTDATWNPVTGCSKVSSGCDHCYAETISLRFGRSLKPWTPENAAENVVLHPDRLEQPLKWRAPRMVFANSMSDLFHELVPFDFVDEVWQVMQQTPRHTYQILTKRPRRMLAYAESRRLWALGNVWLGTSIESWRFNWRADVLRQVPATVRFISAEPLLDTLYDPRHPDRALRLDHIHWVIVGGESGHGARPMNPAWVREIRQRIMDDRVRSQVWTGAPRTAFFFKQWGGRTPKAGGRLLDGVEWNELPRTNGAW